MGGGTNAGPEGAGPCDSGDVLREEELFVAMVTCLLLQNTLDGHDKEMSN
jgi:hypothetical protein